MNTLTAIERHSRSRKSQYPQDRYRLAHKALAGVPGADFEWVQAVEKPRLGLFQRLAKAWRG